MAIDLTDKTILVTGANRGIGRAIVETFLQRGVRKVYAGVRLFDSALPLAELHGDRIQALKMDLLDTTSIRAAAIAAKDVDIVIHNAAILENVSPLEPEAVELWRLQAQVNVEGLLHVAQAFAPALKANGGGAFVQINSSASLRCSARFAIYAATKAAAYSICQGLRQQFAEQNTRMISVHPGPILTDMAVKARIDKDADPPEVVAESIIKALEGDQFLVFPGKTAEKVGEAYAPFAEAFLHRS